MLLRPCLYWETNEPVQSGKFELPPDVRCISVPPLLMRPKGALDNEAEAGELVAVGVRVEGDECHRMWRWWIRPAQGSAVHVRHWSDSLNSAHELLKEKFLVHWEERGASAVFVSGPAHWLFGCWNLNRASIARRLSSVVESGWKFSRILTRIPSAKIITQRRRLGACVRYIKMWEQRMRRWGVM